MFSFPLAPRPGNGFPVPGFFLLGTLLLVAFNFKTPRQRRESNDVCALTPRLRVASR
jgi:hypothetical protein